MGVNKIILVGFLGSDPKLLYGRGGEELCRFSVATKSKIKGQSKTVWHQIVLFGVLAKQGAKVLRKGVELYIEGALEEGKEKGERQVVGEEFWILG